MRFLKKIRGFSLMEVLIVLFLAALVYEAAFCSFKPILEKVSNNKVLEELLSALRFARQEAIIRHARVGICKTDDQHNCAEYAEEAVLVYLASEEAVGVLDESRALQVFRLSSTKRNGQLKWRFFPRQRSHLQFISTGRTRQQNGTFWYCAGKAVLPVWAVMVSQSGRWRVLYPNDKGKIPDEKGNFLTC